MGVSKMNSYPLLDSKKDNQILITKDCFNKPKNKNIERVKGLDSLRFAMAIIVLIGHGGVPKTGLKYLDGFLGNSFVGIAAVIFFFVISGFVIYYPFSLGVKKINIAEFYLKRITRVAIPALVAFIIYKVTFNLYMGVVWSLFCEVIYYLLYPIFLKKIKKINLLIGISFIVSYLFTLGYELLFEVYNGNFHRYGYYLTWIIGLPAWLLGVKLAINFKDLKKKQVKHLFLKLSILRSLVFLSSVIASVIKFHAEVSYAITLPIFSLLVYIWLQYELIYHISRKENKLLIYGGKISYSIYLIHALILHALEYFWEIKNLPINLFFYLIAILLSLTTSWLFYVMIEKPSHKFARSIKINKKMKNLIS